jgi:hypothetical protein
LASSEHEGVAVLTGIAPAFLDYSALDSGPQNRLWPCVEPSSAERLAVHPELSLDAPLPLILQLATKASVIRFADESEQHGAGVAVRQHR